MTLERLVQPYPWALYSRKLRSRIVAPRNVGTFDERESEERGMRLARGEDGAVEDGNFVCLFALVDKEDGIICDARFSALGQSALIGAADIAVELLIGKNYDQAGRITAELIDKQARDRPSKPSFPEETYPHINLVLTAIFEMVGQCQDLPLSETYVAPPVPNDASLFEGDGYPGWDELPPKQKLLVVEQMLDEHVRPYIALDAGGIDVVELNEKRELTIAYQGSCTSCYSSVGATLSYIQQILRAKVHPELNVIPNFDEAPTGDPPWMG